MGLWQVLKDGGGARNIANVEELVEYAAGKLILVRETFPDYTMHDKQHSENVLGLMEELLGADIVKVTPLEAAMLILAAYFHDIGMVYHPDELAALIEEPDFKDFLEANPTAYLQAHEADKVPQQVIVEYCRARHAERVSSHLFKLDPNKLAWDDRPIAEELATLCKSHNESTKALRSELFSINFLGSCDLRMCAIMLRLADILDFDKTRSPAAVYDHLRLAGADGTRAISDMEWSKHLASRGFHFPGARTPNYPITAIAGPSQPAVENALRKFLDVVEKELHESRVLLDFCDVRSRTLMLPGSIDRSGIKGHGYRSGEYQFVLDRHEVLRLFMGDKLYSDPYVFIRELLQNAIDACRLHVYLHDADPNTMEVRVSAWEDDEGNYWLRVDDTGVGMDRHIVEKYFLGVGRSYYNSDELKADVLRKNKPQQNFVAISRFGIGVLSSFIVGDRIEVSTRRRLPDGKLADPLRLSLNSLDDFFVMQDPPMVPSPFPGRTCKEIDYRKTPGTSVSVRINPAKSDIALGSLLDRARDYFFFPPVRVYLNDVEERGRGLAEQSTPLIDSVVRYEIPHNQDGETADLLAATSLSVFAIPLDLTANTPSPAVLGQLVCMAATANGSASLLPALPAELRRQLPDSLQDALGGCIVEHYAFIYRPRARGLEVKLGLTCQLDALEALRNHLGVREFNVLFRNNNVDSSIKYRAETANLYDDHFVDISVLVGEVAAGRVARGLLGYNGIRIPARVEDAKLLAEENLLVSVMLAIGGTICLFDDLRPDVSVSRDLLRDLSFEIHSAIQLAVRRAASIHLGSETNGLIGDIMQTDLFAEVPLRGTRASWIREDPLASEWRAEQVYELDGGWLSLDELRALAEKAPVELSLPGALWSREFDDRLYGHRRFYGTLLPAMLESELDIEMADWSSDRPSNTVIVRSGNRPARPPGLSVLPPFTAVPYEPSEVLVGSGYPANLRNPIISWFADSAAMLEAEYPALFAQFRRALASVANLIGKEDKEKPGVTASAVELLNGALDRIRRSVPYASDVLATEVYAGDDFTLRSRM